MPASAYDSVPVCALRAVPPFPFWLFADALAPDCPLWPGALVTPAFLIFFLALPALAALVRVLFGNERVRRAYPCWQVAGRVFGRAFG